MSACLSRYRERLREDFEHEIPTSRKKDRAEMKRSVVAWGKEDVLKTIDWVFDHWAFYRKAFKLKAHDYPPRFLFTGQGWMEHLIFHARKGELPGGGGGWSWDQHTEKQMKDRQDDAQDALEDLL